MSMTILLIIVERNDFFTEYYRHFTARYKTEKRRNERKTYHVRGIHSLNTERLKNKPPCVVLSKITSVEMHNRAN